MKKIFICMPLKAATITEIKTNIAKAEYQARMVALEGNIPVVPHQIAWYLKEDAPEERELGMLIARRQLSECNQVNVYGNNITEGMQQEITLAKLLGIDVQHKEVDNVPNFFEPQY